MSQLSDLQSTRNLSDVARLLGLKPQSLSYILYVNRHERKYKTFDIPKRSGGTRQICAPEKDLKYFQRQLADLLQDCLEEINKTNNRSDDDKHPDHIAHGFSVVDLSLAMRVNTETDDTSSMST